ncbi:hypothetical protein GALMADRAFT_242782 [Galerina marginata CBS 339.88]|uniref:Transmembrane protein n=1 Tax=Galerina marginata (strain CBS 339.88) TaxID=685588 RepID=A0A067TKE8_GALM3|nr:hypothetical protein GALMADRAFT_242782 [Galerina marginata CBS 339.88]
MDSNKHHASQLSPHDPGGPSSIEMVNLNAPELAEADNSPEPSSSAWHPRITPYRLVNLLVPICIGTAKAAASQRGSSTVPTTLEWVSGVVVFLVLFHAGSYEAKVHIPLFIAWAFKKDCMGLVWELFRFLSIPPPKYNFEEYIGPNTGHIVTSYRLLVSSTVMFFGFIKATLTYSGSSTGATWVEWTLGVVITSVLYFIGLYENNSSGLWPTFFGKNRADAVRSGLKGTSKALIIGTSLVLMALMIFIKRPKDALTEADLPVLLGGYNHAINFIVEGIFVCFFLLGLVILFAGLRSVVEDLGDRIPQSIRSRSEHAFQTVSNIPLRLVRPLLGFAHTMRHTITLLGSIAFFAIWASVVVGVMYRISINDIKVPSRWNPFMYFSMCFLGLVLLVPWVFGFWWAIRGVGSALRHSLPVLAIQLVLTSLMQFNYAFGELRDSLQVPPV